MKVLLYLAEVQDFEKTREKEAFFFLWADVHEMNIVASVCELNDQNCLGIQGLKVIEQMVNIFKIDVVAVLTVTDISSDTQDAYAKLKVLKEMGVKVVSAHNDLPESDVYDIEPRIRANHCTIKMYEN